MGAVDTTYTFTATDTITSAKMNNIIDQTTITTDAIIGTTLDVTSGKLKIRSAGITSNEMGNNSVVTAAITDSSVITAKIANANITAEKLSGAQTGNAPVYGCRAWVNFDGSTSPPTIRASGNVSSVVKNGTGDYTITFTTAMPDSNFCVALSIADLVTASAPPKLLSIPNSSSVRVGFGFGGVAYDNSTYSVAIFR